MRPLLLGHRGASRYAPENTLAAFRLALEHGCDGFEFDLRRTSDAQCYVCHDPRVHGVDVERTSYALLLDRHRRRHPSCSAEECPPPLEEVLRRFSRAFLNLELKVCGLEAAVVELLRRHPPARSLVSSFLPEALLRYRELDAETPLGLICKSRAQLALWSALPLAAVFLHRRLVSPPLVTELHDAGKTVFAWTVNHSREMRRFAEWGVDGLISDDTRLLVQTFERSNGS